MADLDPATGDLTIDVSGALVSSVTPTFEEAQSRIQVHQGTCFWDLTWGSTLHELARAKVTRTFQADLEDRVRTAWRPMLRAGRIADLAFVHERTSTGWSVKITAKDAQQAPIAFDVWVRVA